MRVAYNGSRSKVLGMVKRSWQNEGDQLVSRWSDDGHEAPYTPPWAAESSVEVRRPSDPIEADFPQLSPFGHREWRQAQPK